MDSTTIIGYLQGRIDELTKLLTTYQNTVAQTQNEIDAVTAILTAWKAGYQTDQARIDTEIQKAKDAMAQQVTALVPTDPSVPIDPVSLTTLATTLTS